jgi:hypothetical protein
MAFALVSRPRSAATPESGSADVPPFFAARTIPLIQARLELGRPGDAFEQEADRIADQVMSAQPVRRAPGNGGPSGDRLSLKEEPGTRKPEYDKAEVEFHSALHFNRTFSGFNPTREPREGELFIIWFAVWNTGWKTAPAHTNRLTIYKADLCSGCRYDKDEIFRLEMAAPSIVPGDQPGQSEYDQGFLVGSPLPQGRYDAYVELDVHREVDEINEDNNTAFITFAVGPGDESASSAGGAGEAIQRKRDSGPDLVAGQGMEPRIGRPSGGGEPLPGSVRAFFEPRFGHDFSRVRIHSDDRAAGDAARLRAQAFTIGRDIVFARARYAPETSEGRHLLAHELAHVVQQTGGRRHGT